jgi:hypothetical protein
MPATKIPNILFSTTRMWNCGDDFILFGLQELLKEVVGPFNPVVYNRNPELHAVRLYYNKPQKLRIKDMAGAFTVNPYRLVSPALWRCDNSWRPGNDTAIDFCFFAGTPEWFGIMVSPLVKRLLETQIPVAYVAVGAFEKTRDTSFDRLPQQDQALLRRAGLVTVRDSACRRVLEPVNPTLLPCTALFSAPHEKRRTPGARLRLALSTQGVGQRNGQRIGRETFDYSVELFKKLSKRHDCTLVCHYVDEMHELREHLGDCMPFAYSYDARDYISIYDRFDLTVTTRVHGAGLAASLGVPGVVLAHSTRSETTDGFLAERVDCTTDTVDQVIDKIEALPVAERSAALIEHKRSTRQRYMPLLREFISGNGDAPPNRVRPKSSGPS